MPSSSQFLACNGAYDAETTLVHSGQAFGWQTIDGWIYGMLAGHVYKLRSVSGGVEWGCSGDLAEAGGDLRGFLCGDESLESIIKSFPEDDYLRAAVQFAPGLRLVRQDPWECLASFLISPLKQIAQIKAVLHSLRRGMGTPVSSDGHIFHSFPDAGQIARVGEEALRLHKMGFRARNLLGTARQIDRGDVSLVQIAQMDYPRAKEELCKLRGVGPKVADCVLLFAYGRQEAFPIDVWIERVLHRLYFPRARKLHRDRLERFAAKYFPPHGGYAQQYLFHYIRHHPEILTPRTPKASK